VAAVVVVADAWVPLAPSVPVVAAVVQVHALCSLILRRCGLQLGLSPLALVVPVARRKQRQTPTATLVLLAPTQRLVDSCVRVAGVAVLPVTLWPQQAASPVTV